MTEVSLRHWPSASLIVRPETQLSPSWRESHSTCSMLLLTFDSLIQLQGESKSLHAVVEAMPSSSKDMLANRRATMATGKTSGQGHTLAKTSIDLATQGDLSSPRITKRAGLSQPRTSQIPSNSSSTENSPKPVSKAIPSPTIKLTRTTTDSPSQSRTIQPPSGLSRPSAVPASRLQRPSDVFGGDNSNAEAPARPTALQPLGRPPAARHSASSRSSGPSVIEAINDIRHDDLDRCVDALKTIQSMLNANPDSFVDNVETLADTLMDEMEFAFTPPENLNNPRFFRVVKHLIQSFSGLSSNQTLMRRMSYEQLYTVLNCFSFRLVQADRMGGTIQELSRFINLILVQCLSTPDRLLVFQVMFRLLLDLTHDFSVTQPSPESERAAHADLVIKCLWKRCKILEDDFRSGRLKPGPILAVLEEFLQDVGPKEYRKRAQQGIALGDMPLRTVKTIIQRLLGEKVTFKHLRAPGKRFENF